MQWGTTGFESFSLTSFGIGNLPETLPSGARFLQLELNSRYPKGKIKYERSAPTTFEAQIYFHAIIFMSREAVKKKLNIFCDARNNTLAGMNAYLCRMPMMRFNVLFVWTVADCNRIFNIVHTGFDTVRGTIVPTVRLYVTKARRETFWKLCTAAGTHWSGHYGQKLVLRNWWCNSASLLFNAEKIERTSF